MTALSSRALKKAQAFKIGRVVLPPKLN